MSVTSCLLLSLLCLSLHACNARPLAASDKNLEKKFRISHQNDQKEIAVTSNDHEAVKGDSIAETHELDDKTQKLKDLKVKQKLLMDEKPKNSGAVEKESLVSVSWPVPQKNRGEKHPGFNLDYSPPKTHPPSHN